MVTVGSISSVAELSAMWIRLNILKSCIEGPVESLMFRILRNKNGHVCDLCLGLN